MHRFDQSAELIGCDDCNVVAAAATDDRMFPVFDDFIEERREVATCVRVRGLDRHRLFGPALQKCGGVAPPHFGED